MSAVGGASAHTHALCWQFLPTLWAGGTTVLVPKAYELRIADPTGVPVAPGETGELLVRGVRGLSLFAEYLGDPKATAAAFLDGYFRTGDLVTLTPTGGLKFAGRAKDMLKVSGENVVAAEIERVIAAVADVTAAAVGRCGWPQ
jgi:crotonobetaine/carnitine-CoA ligase